MQYTRERFNYSLSLGDSEETDSQERNARVEGATPKSGGTVRCSSPTAITWRRGRESVESER
jgi:hypothetical protein